MTDLKLGTVPYLNAEPLVWPLANGIIKHNHSIIRALPTELVDKLNAGELDCAVAPVAAMLVNPDFVPIPGVAIASRGAVASVLIFHDDPFVICIQGVGGLVKEEVIRIFINRPGNQNPLFLSLAQSVTLLPDFSHKTEW